MKLNSVLFTILAVVLSISQALAVTPTDSPYDGHQASELSATMTLYPGTSVLNYGPGAFDREREMSFQYKPRFKPGSIFFGPNNKPYILAPVLSGYPTGSINSQTYLPSNGQLNDNDIHIQTLDSNDNWVYYSMRDMVKTVYSNATLVVGTHEPASLHINPVDNDIYVMVRGGSGWTYIVHTSNDFSSIAVHRFPGKAAAFEQPNYALLGGDRPNTPTITYIQQSGSTRTPRVFRPLKNSSNNLVIPSPSGMTTGVAPKISDTISQPAWASEHAGKSNRTVSLSDKIYAVALSKTSSGNPGTDQYGVQYKFTDSNNDD